MFIGDLIIIRGIYLYIFKAFFFKRVIFPRLFLHDVSFVNCF